jgi:O-antigen ligase
LPALFVRLGIISLVVYWVATWVRAPRRELRLNALDVLLAFFVFWSAFSLLFAPYYHAAEAAALTIFCYVALYGYLSFNPSFAGLSLVLRAVRAQAALQSMLVLGQAIGYGRVRPAGTFFNPNFLAGFIAIALVLVIGGQLFPPPGGERRPVRWLLAAAEGALLLAALLTTESRGGTLALFAGVLLLFVVRSWKVAVAACSLAAVALLAIPNPLLRRLISLPHSDNFAFTRLSVWKGALSMMLDHPWLGIGLGQYEYVSSRYAFPILTHWAKYTRVAETAHSEYLQAGAELGLPGILVALGAVALLAQAGVARLRALPRASWGPIATMLAAAASLAVHAAVDLPFHTPTGALLLVALVAGLRLHGVTGPERTISLRVRPFYAVSVGLIALVLAAAAARPLVGFWYYLGGIGAPRNLFNEKWSLEEAPRRELPLEESTRLVGLAARVDFPNAPYRRALGGQYFQLYQHGTGGQAALRQALYQLNFAAELNPNQFQYAVNLGQAMTTLARLEPSGRGRLEEALGHYRHAIELAPYQFPVWTEIGLLADELGDAAAAEAAFRRAVEIEEFYLRGWFNLGTFYARHGRLAQAREAFARGAALAEKARTLVPTSRAEADLVALKPSLFYNELEKIRSQERTGGASS